MVTIKTIPISVNMMYRGRRFLTKEGKETKEKMAWEIKSQYKGLPLEGNISVEIYFYFKDNRKDIDNCLKGVLDCMKGILWNDDRQITELLVHKRIDKLSPRVEINI